MLAFLVWLGIFLCSGQYCFAQNDALEKKVSIAFKNTDLRTALEKFQKQSGVSIAFEPEIIPQKAIQNKIFNSERVRNILSFLLKDSGLEFELLAGSVVINKQAPVPFTLNGIVFDEETGENLIGALLEIGNEKQFSNQYGYFSISLPQGNYPLIVNFVGYKQDNQLIKHTKDKYLSIGLKKNVYELAQVSISGKNPSEDSLEMVKSIIKPSIRNIMKIPYFAGEIDAMKALQMEQGVKNASEGSSAISVRGGGYDQNLILIDEAPIYNASHLFGLVSTLNIDALKNVELYPDYMPSRYGGRISSVVDTKLAEGSLTDYHIKGGLSLLSAGLATEGPIVKNKSSFLFAARRSLVDLLNYDFRYFNVNANYYDINLKTNFILSTKDRIYLSFYHGFDHLFSEDNFANDWTNTTITFRLNHVYTPKLFMNFSAIYSNYRSSLSLNNKSTDNNEWLTGIRDVTLKADFSYYHSSKNHIQFGVSGTRHHLKPGETLVDDKSTSLNRVSSLEYALYFDNDIEILSYLHLRYGIRAGIYNESSQIEQNIYGPSWSHYSLEPRAQLIFELKKDRLLKFSYNRTIQHLQVLQNNEQAYSAMDTYISSGPLVPPQRADFFSATFSYLKNPKSVYNFSGYFRRSFNQLDLLDHAKIILNPDYKQFIRFGIADSYGIELSTHQKIAGFTANLNYSYSRVFKKIDGINDGQRYAANYDIPNDLKLSLSYPLSNRLVLSSLFSYRTGRTITLPVGYYTYNSSKVPIYQGRNNARFPDFNRLDIVLQLNPKIPKKDNQKRAYEGTWNFGIYNVYNRRNPMFYRLATIEPDKNLGFEESFSGIMPSLSYNFRF